MRQPVAFAAAGPLSVRGGRPFCVPAHPLSAGCSALGPAFRTRWAWAPAPGWVPGGTVTLEIVDGFHQALRLIVGADPALLQIVFLSLRISASAVLFSTVVGVPLGAWLGLRRFIGRRLVIAFLYTGMGFPPVVVGLSVYLLLSRSGVVGAFGWWWLPHLFTPNAMVIAQIIIATPLVAGFTMAAVMGVDPNLRWQLISLGATPWQATWALLREARLGVVVSIVAGFGSIISEVGAVMLVGGNIEGSTRVLTTAIVLETRKGNFDLALAMGIVLLTMTFLINAVVLWLQGKAYD